MRKNVFTRISKKLLKIIYQLIYKNYVYKPVGIYSSGKEYVDKQTDKKAIYIEIYPKLVSTLHISRELFEACSEYVKPVLHIETNYNVIIIPQGRIHTDNESSVAVISHDNRLIADVSFNYQNSRIVSPELNNIFKQKYYNKPKKFKGTVFTLLTGGSGLNNYFHWLVDALPRIHLLRESGYFDQVNWFLIPSCQFSYQKYTLRLLGISEDKLIEGDKYPHITADSLIASTAPRGNYTIIPNWVCEFLKNSFTANTIHFPKSSKYVYISRKDSAFRHVHNEEALVTLLEKYGFNSFVLSHLNFEEQVSLFASAEVIIAPHGAGLINLSFCKKGTKILEIFASGYVKATYFDLSQKIGLDYYYIICPGKKVKTARQGMKLDIIVELDKIKFKLNHIFPALQNIELT